MSHESPIISTVLSKFASLTRPSAASVATPASWTVLSCQNAPRETGPQQDLSICPVGHCLHVSDPYLVAQKSFFASRTSHLKRPGASRTSQIDTGGGRTDELVGGIRSDLSNRQTASTASELGLLTFENCQS